MTDLDSSEFLPKRFRGPDTNIERLNARRTHEEAMTAQYEFNKKLLAELRAKNPWGPCCDKPRVLTEDEYLLDVATMGAEDRKSYPYYHSPTDTDMPDIRKD